jgi:hypothetical protein
MAYALATRERAMQVGISAPLPRQLIGAEVRHGPLQWSLVVMATHGPASPFISFIRFLLHRPPALFHCFGWHGHIGLDAID